MRADPAPSKAVFLDKDGTLVVDVPYNVDPEKITLAPGAAAGLSSLARRGFKLVVISNQSGVARGLFEEAALAAVEARLAELLGEFDARLDGFYYCPHHPQGTVGRYAVACECRKPRPGLIERAARELGVDASRSFFVGDILDDVEAGRRAGCATVLIDNGNETEWEWSERRTPDHVAVDLADAAEWIARADAEFERRDRVRPTQEETP